MPTLTVEYRDENERLVLVQGIAWIGPGEIRHQFIYSTKNELMPDFRP